MDLAYRKDHIDTFVIVSGDSDFSPLVSKLKENGKHVIGLGREELDLGPAASTTATSSSTTRTSSGATPSRRADSSTACPRRQPRSSAC